MPGDHRGAYNLIGAFLDVYGEETLTIILASLEWRHHLQELTDPR